LQEWVWYINLLFADDTLVFLEVQENQANVINNVLRRYEMGTGQLINPLKCSMMFGSACTEEEQETVKALLNVDNIPNEERYLGLPTLTGRMSKDRFKTTKERLLKFTSWAERYMSVGAKEILIKSVAQAIPTYIMGAFKLSATLCEEMTWMIRYFQWGTEDGQSKVHWLPWEKLLMPKHLGGMGFRDMKYFNQALLAWQAWRLIQFPDSLCARLLKAKYYP
jgi:hypothetical protein